MDQAWLLQRPHLKQLVRGLDEVLQLADEQDQQDRASGDAVDYGELEERVARASANVEHDVHRIALSGLDVDVPFIRVWANLSPRSSYRTNLRIPERTGCCRAHALS